MLWAMIVTERKFSIGLNEFQDLRIGYLLSDERIKQGLALATGQQEMFIFVFNHIKDGKIYFYSATHAELDAKPELKHLFLGYGSRKASWRIYKLQFTPVDPEQSYRPLSIANSINDKVKRQNQKPHPTFDGTAKKHYPCRFTHQYF